MGSRLLAKHTKLRMYTKFRLQNSRIWFHRAVTPTRLWLAGAGWSQSPGIGVRLGQQPPSWPQSRSEPTVLENNHGGFVTEIFAFERTSCLLTTAKILGAELFWLLSESRCAATSDSDLIVGIPLQVVPIRSHS